MIIFQCTTCDAQFNSQATTLPAGWGKAGSNIYCPACSKALALRADKEAQGDWWRSPTPPILTAATPSDAAIGAGVERFFAVPMPRRGGVTIFFDRGSVELSLAESEALCACLTGANTILKTQHPAQKQAVQ